MKLVYPNVTGALCAKMNRGLSGQDAVNGMAVVFAAGPSASETVSCTRLTWGGGIGRLELYA